MRLTSCLLAAMPTRQVVVDHVDLRVTDLDASCAFYAAVLQPLGFTLLRRTPDNVDFGLAGADDFGLSRNAQPSRGVHVAFAADSEAAVDQFYAAALAAGARDNGAPGYRHKYHANYYAAFILDAEGNNIEAVYHGTGRTGA